MENIKYKQITEINEEDLNKITKWIFEWWGENLGYSFEAMKEMMSHCFNKDKLPKTYGLYLNDVLIGIYQLVLHDLDVRPDLYPWFTNFYIEEKHRGKGFGRTLIKHLKEELPQFESYDTLYIYTKNIGLYEKYGWEFVKEIDTFIETPRIQRLYKFNLNSQ